jgi:2-dehydropantoate 2-reductase
MTPEVADNILHWLWIHNATSAAIWAGFYQYRDMKEFFKDGVLIRESFEATKECLDICRKKGVDVDSYGGISYFKWPTMVIVPIFKLMFTFNKSMQVFTAHAASESSALEMRGSFKEIYDSGKSLDVPMPNMDRLYALVKAY